MARTGWREKLKTWRLPVPAFDIAARTTSLLVVDMQYADAHPEYGLGRVFQTVDPERAEYYFGRLRDTVVPNTAELLKFFRANGLRVTFLVLGPLLADGSDLSPNFKKRYQKEQSGLGFRVTFPAGTFEHSILAEIAPAPGELTINKTANGAFNASNIDLILRNIGIETLIVTGVGTEVCVETTARDAVDHGYNTIVVDDACATLDPEAHDASLLAFAQWFGEVATTAEVIARLQQSLPA